MNQEERDHQPLSFFERARDVTITGGHFTVVGSDNNISHYGSTTTFRFDDPPLEEHVPSVLNVNCGNVNKTRLENVANQNVHLHLHYTEIYSTPKDGGDPIRTERFDYDMVPGADLSALDESDADEQDHKRSLDGVFSRALDVADKSKKSRELKKTFKSLLGLLQDDLADEGNVSNSTITEEEEENSSESTEYFSACDIPLPCHPIPPAPFDPHTGNKPESHEADAKDIPWTETVHDFVSSVTAMSRRAAGTHADDRRNPNPARTAPIPSPAPQALPSLSAAQAPLYHPDLINLIQDAVSEAVKKQFAVLQIDTAASTSHLTPASSRKTSQRKSVSPRPSLSLMAHHEREREALDEPLALNGIWEGRIFCDYRQVKARLPGRRDLARQGAVIKERTMGRFMMSLDPRSPVGAVEGEHTVQPRRQIKRPRPTHRRNLDGYDADGDDSDDG